MSDLCYVCKCPEGYCPPDYYPRLYTSNEVNAFYTTLTSNPRGGVISNAIDNSIGRVKFKTIESSGDATAIESIYEPEVVLVYSHNKFYIGLVDSYKWVSENVMEIVYTVDWFTSYILTEKRGGNVRPDLIGKTVLYRRLANGEHIESDEGFKPVKEEWTKLPLTVTIGQAVQPLFKPDSHSDDIPSFILLVYHHPNTNTDHWLIRDMPFSNGLIPTSYYAKTMWTEYCKSINLDSESGNFNPKGVMFYGYSFINYAWFRRYCEYHSHDGHTSYSINRSSTADQSFDKVALIEDNISIDRTVTPTKYNRLVFRDGDSSVIYEWDYAKTYGPVLFDKVYCNWNMISPALVFKIKPANGYTDSGERQFSMSLPFYPLTFFVDSEQVYRAEERTYNNDMRKLQATNELVSGIIGSANQGAMISAFSRTQTGVGSSRGGSPQPPLAVNKGLIGGGIGAVGAVAGFAYQSMYASKQTTLIEDAYYRGKADTMLMSGCVPPELNKYMGVYLESYDSFTIDCIEEYQSAFGYLTNKIDTNVVLNNLTGYVQADVIMSKGMRTEVARYVKDMFNYGVTFTVIGGSNGN